MAAAIFLLKAMSSVERLIAFKINSTESPENLSKVISISPERRHLVLGDASAHGDRGLPVLVYAPRSGSPASVV